MNVYWLMAAKERLRAELHGESQGMAHWLPRLNAVLGEVFAGHMVLVRDRYSGYRAFDGLVILFVEVQPTPVSPSCRFASPGTYIVKVAFDDRRAALKAEIGAWNSARPDFFHGDNVFVSLQAYPNVEDPTALIYGDANAVLGQRNILSLEEAITQSCRFGVPKPESIQRVLRSLYGRLNAHFLSYAHVEFAKDYLRSPRPKLADLIAKYEDDVLPSHDTDRKNDHLVRQFRRETLALLAKEHEQYADPIDLLRGLKDNEVGPPILRGTAHGDLHARNVQVAVDHDEVVNCAIFDYESFSESNFVAWDFIKLEIETAVRLLDRLGDPASMPNYVNQCLDFWVRVARRTEAHDRHQAVLDVPTADECGPEWRRLEDLLVAIRLMAYEHLGSNRIRVFDWLAEYELMTVWYGARAAMYPTYNRRLSVAALVAAGVAARRLMRRQPVEIELGHRRRYVVAKARARGHGTLEEGATELESIARDFPHVLEVQEELALARIKQKLYPSAEDILEGIAGRYDHTSPETPSLMGSMWKRRAFAATPFDLRALERSITWYGRAVKLFPNDHYPRINLATLLVVHGRKQEGRIEASRVLEILEATGLPDFWAAASRGEAKLLLGEDPAGALEDYRFAAADPDCRPRDRESMRDQILFLRPHFAESVRGQLTDDVLTELFQLAQEIKP